MEIEDIITLDNNLEYIVLDKTSIENRNYLYCVQIDENEDPTTEYKFFEEVGTNEDLSVLEVTDENIMEVLLNIFTINHLSDSIKESEEQDV